MKVRITVLVLVVLPLFLLAGCITPKESLKNSGLFGEHPLIRIEKNQRS